jgi:hypothetical protein
MGVSLFELDPPLCYCLSTSNVSPLLKRRDEILERMADALVR